MEHVFQDLTVTLPHVEPDPWIVAGEICNGLRQRVEAECRRATDPQFGLVPASQIVRQSTDPALGQHDSAGFLEDAFAKRCRHDSLPRADHQFKPQPAFHQFHIPRQGRLRQPERCRRAGKGSGADDFVELQEMTRVNASHDSLYQNLMRGGKRMTLVYRRLCAGSSHAIVAPWRTNKVSKTIREL